MNYFIFTYGCQMNIHESEKIAGILENMGCISCQEFENADILVYNTCCIRETAEQKIFGHLGLAKKLKEKRRNLITIVCGCMSQQDGMSEHLRRKFPFVDIVLGTSNLNLLESAVNTVLNERKRVVDTEEFSAADSLPVLRTSFPNAWVNIIYGCNNFCTYCIVPHVRGRERSRSMESIVEEVESLLQDGYKEITLLGQNVNSYGHDRDDGSDFSKLLDILGNLPYKYRLRFMTSHPKDLNEDVINAIACHANICNNIHLPVQSGSNRILKAMNRRYTREHYLQLIDKIRDRLPDVGITTDIMVGFPGETDEDFADTVELVKRVRYSSAFCFVYSRRKGTPAYSMENQISKEVKKSRITQLLQVQNEITKEISYGMHGNIYEILVEDKNAKFKNTYCGRTESGRLVNFKCDVNPIGNFVKVKICDSRSATLWGELITEE
ncbi:MAG: tRNA (N6-isopentenyl adenosine(37)-C2)-methylthiotransferase MiaB [Corallococcus sp.]|nr:tRNA (N6-isopentenyl adenosine(37)-C2)-methylthiotransferase MiaB [Corallococcus sp.]